MTKFILLLLLSASSVLSESITPLVIDKSFIKTSPGESVYYHVAADKMDIIQVSSLQSGQWSKIRDGKNGFGSTKLPHWFMIQAEIQDNQPVDLVINVENTLLDFVELYYTNDGIRFSSLQAGNKIQNSPSPTFKLKASHPGKYYFYLRVSSSEASMYVPITVYRKSGYEDYLDYLNFYTGLYLGLIIAVVLYNFSIYFSFRDKSYLYYCGYHIGIVLFFLNSSGFGKKYFWNNSDQNGLIYFILTSPLIIISSIIIFSVLFFKHTLPIKELSPASDKLYNILLGISLVSAAAGLFVISRENLHSLIRFNNLILFLSFLSFVIVSGYLFLKKNKMAYYTFPAWILVNVGFQLRYFLINGMISSSLFSEHGYKISITTEALLISVALSRRINIIQKDKITAENTATAALHELQKAHEKLNDYSQTLESKVEIRTRELNESEKRYRSLIEASPDAIALHSDGKIHYVNNAAVKMIGGNTPNELIGRQITDFIYPKYVDIVRERLVKLGTGRETSLPIQEQKYLRLDGSEFDVEVSTSIITNDDGNIIFQSVIRDISERKRIEKLREDTERIIKHDLKNPLNGVIGFSELMLSDENNFSEGDRELLHHINRCGLDMMSLINHSLDIYKIEEGLYKFEPEDVDIIKLLNLLELNSKNYFKSKELNFRYHFQGMSLEKGQEFMIRGERLLLSSLFGNLIKNACEASGKNDTIVFFVSENKGNCFVDIHNRKSIPAGIVENLFKKYSTSGKKGGTGLGMYSAKLIAKAHGGDITITSSETEGTHVTVVLPVGSG